MAIRLKIISVALFSFFLVFVFAAPSKADPCQTYTETYNTGCVLGADYNVYSAGGDCCYGTCNWGLPGPDAIDGSCGGTCQGWGCVGCGGPTYYCPDATCTKPCVPNSPAGCEAMCFSCTYIKSVDYTGGICEDGVMLATSQEEETLSQKVCPVSVPISKPCGICKPGSSSTVYKNATEITSASACAYGIVSTKVYEKYDGHWSWICDNGSDVSPTCTGLNSFIDIGLRIKDDSAPGGVIVVGVEEETNESPLKIYKDMSPNPKKIWSIGLVPTTHADASKARVKVSAGERALKKATPAVVECCKLEQSTFPCKLCACVPDCSNAPNVCTGDVFTDGCGGTCTGTKIGTCSGAATICSGTMFNDSCGNPTCTGTMPGTCSNASSYNTDCSYADSCGSKTCTGSVVKTSQWYMNDRTNMSCNALCIANGWNVCLAIGINATAPFWSANTQRYIYSSASYSPGTSVNTVITNDMKTWCNCYKNVLPCP